MQLSDPVATVTGIGDKSADKLARLKIFTVRDLLFHLPKRYNDFSQTIALHEFDAHLNEEVTTRATVISKTFLRARTGRNLTAVTVYDGKVRKTFMFFGPPYITADLKKNQSYYFYGKLTAYRNQVSITNPSFSPVEEQASKFSTIYPLTSGLTNKFFTRNISKILHSDINFSKLDFIKSYLDNKTLNLYQSLEIIHNPNDLKLIEKAKSRLAIDEVVLIRLANSLRRKKWQKTLQTHKYTNFPVASILKNLPITMTEDQLQTLEDIVVDFKKPKPANRVIQGDVGSGKTIVAGIAGAITASNRLQTIILAPTEILANQHFDSLQKFFPDLDIGIFTSSKKNWGQDITIGTHALLEKKALEHFKKNAIGLVIVDEQHRFGVNQRSKIFGLGARKNIYPHFLSLTATPIPRTIALTIYGDVDLSQIKSFPKGHRRVSSHILTSTQKPKAYQFIEKELQKGNSALFIAPIIEESETSLGEIESVKKLFLEVSKYFRTQKVFLLHGRLKSSEKDHILTEFAQNPGSILVSTPVVEVGIDIPDLSILVISSSERFGLSQLHQLRGRIGRKGQIAYCFLFHSKDKIDSVRLKHFIREHDGGKLALLDLKTRGAGETYGYLQHGKGNFKIADLSSIELIKKASNIADQILLSDPDLTNTYIKEYLQSFATPDPID